MYILGQYYQVLCNSLSGPALSIWVFDITLSGPAFQIVFVYHSINVKFYIYRILIESVSLSSIIPKSFVYYSKKDHYQHIYRPFILWRFHLVDFEKTYEYFSWIRLFGPFLFVTEIQLSNITVNKSKDHSFSEDFTLWILIKHMNIHSWVKTFCLFFVCDKDSTVKYHWQPI